MCLKTPSVSPNNSFFQEHQKNTDISPTLRDLEPGYVSNLAEFWTQKALRDNPGSNESVEISGELLLQEDSSTLEAEFIKLQVGVMRPISRDNDANRAKDVTKNLETSKEPMTENNSVQKVSKVEHKNLRDEKKETLIIEKEPPFVPIENSTQAKNYINKKIHSENSREAPQELLQRVVEVS